MSSFIDFNDIEHLFDGTFTFVSSDTSWTVDFTSPAYAGYQLVLTGTGFSGSDGLPSTGTITGLSLSNGTGTIVSMTGLSLLASKFLDMVDLEIEGAEDDDDDEDDAEDDDILCGDDDDHIDGHDGDDDIYGGKGADDLYGGTGHDSLKGADGNDDLFGESGDDSLSGGNDADHLRGGSGRDKLNGGYGNDKIEGGSGRDVLSGGAGHDRFVFKARSDSGASSTARDVITDFRHGDKIDLSVMDANTKSAGNQIFKFVKDFTKSAGQVQWNKTSTGFYLSGDVNGDGVADFSIQVKTTVSKLYSSDFVL